MQQNLYKQQSLSNQAFQYNQPHCYPPLGQSRSYHKHLSVVE